MPDADIVVDEALARRLIDTQFPDLSGLPLATVGEGWDNVMFRLGDDLVVRLPRREAAAGLIANEQDWLAPLAPWLSLPAPAPIRRGAPDASYPWRWTIARWIDGETADLDRPKPDEAQRLGVFLRALHRAAPETAPTNPVRGVPLAARATGIEERMGRLRLETNAITPEIDVLWTQALAAKPNGTPVWLHGDLHPRNVLVRKGVLMGVIDWGDLCAGDPATDLAAFWMLVEDNAARAAAVESYGADADLIARAKGWAILFGVVLLDAGRVNDPRHAAIGTETLRRLTRCPI